MEREKSLICLTSGLCSLPWSFPAPHKQISSQSSWLTGTITRASPSVGAEKTKVRLKDFERTFSLDFILEPMGADSDQPGVGRMALVIMGGGELSDQHRAAHGEPTKQSGVCGSDSDYEDHRLWSYKGGGQVPVPFLTAPCSSLPGKHALFSYHLPERITSPGPQE